jgi:hypothetical protein
MASEYGRELGPREVVQPRNLKPDDIVFGRQFEMVYQPINALGASIRMQVINVAARLAEPTQKDPFVMDEAYMVCIVGGPYESPEQVVLQSYRKSELQIAEGVGDVARLFWNPPDTA